jgi:dienelactone hydrolase
VRKIILTALLLLLVTPLAASAEIVDREVEYEHQGVKLMGFLTYDDELEGPLPGIIVVHEWWGLNEHARNSARRLAGLGYAAFALDMYGKGVLAEKSEEAAKLSKPFRRNRKLMQSRAGAGLEALRATGKAEPGNVAAIGYCFGGTTVLEMARGGLPLAGVVSFHGGLSTPKPADEMSCPVLVLHGAADPHVGLDETRAFRSEMRDAGADWQMVYFGGAVHSFTNPAAGDDPSRGVAYDEDAARRSWGYMELFLSEMLGR